MGGTTAIYTIISWRYIAELFSVSSQNGLFVYCISLAVY